MDSTPGAGRYAAATPSSPEVLYDRDIRTTVHTAGPDHMRVAATLKDDTFGPHGFATAHDMTLTVTVAVHDMQITHVHADMVGHPHGTCPITLQQMEQLVGLRITAGYFGELRKRFGGSRSCNHLHTMAQQIGTVAALSFAARLVHDDDSAQRLPPDRWFLNVIDHEPGIIGSCAIWHEDGDLVRRLKGTGT